MWHANLEFVLVSPPCLSNKDPGPCVKVHGVRRTLKVHHPWHCLTVLVEGHLLLKDSQRETGPFVHQARHVEARGLERRLGIRLGVEKLHSLATRLHGAELNGHIHKPLGPIGDGEEDGGC